MPIVPVEFRKRTAGERAALDLLVDANRKHADVIRDALGDPVVVAECTCGQGCFTVRLDPARTPATWPHTFLSGIGELRTAPLPGHLEVEDDILVHAYLHLARASAEVEFWWLDGSEPDSRPLPPRDGWSMFWDEGFDLK